MYPVLKPFEPTQSVDDAFDSLQRQFIEAIQQDPLRLIPTPRWSRKHDRGTALEQFQSLMGDAEWLELARLLARMALAPADEDSRKLIAECSLRANALIAKASKEYADVFAELYAGIE